MDLLKNLLFFCASLLMMTGAIMAHDDSIDYKHLPDSYYKENLPSDVYAICRHKSTEAPRSGKYDKFYEEGTYYCACCGGNFPVYSSAAKFDSGTGWPSFWEPISPENVELREDKGFFSTRTEVCCGRCGSHLGHVFDDGPLPTGKRYCMNSLALTFVPIGAKGKGSLDRVSFYETAIFAGGCFWCMEAAFDDCPGVISVVSGYTGGTRENPTYEQVSAGGTGHLESVQVTFDPQKISYDDLLEIFWHNVDPFNAKGQFCDVGDSYHAAIFYTNERQKEKAEAAKKYYADVFKESIATEIRPATLFYPAEEYHQQYSKKNPIRYHFYRGRCGRDSRLKEVWGNEKTA